MPVGPARPLAPGLAFAAWLLLAAPAADAASIRAWVDPTLDIAVGDRVDIGLFLDLAADEEASVFEGQFDLVGLEHLTDVTLDPGGDTWAGAAGQLVGEQVRLSLTSANRSGDRRIATLSATWSDDGPFGVLLSPGAFAQRDIFEPPFLEDLELTTEAGSVLFELGDLAELAPEPEPEPIAPPEPEPIPEPEPPDPEPLPEPEPRPDPDPPLPEPEPDPPPEPDCRSTLVTTASMAFVLGGPSQSHTGVMLFAAEDEEHGEELWRSDGTAEGTYLLSDISAGPVGSVPRELTPLNGRVFFRADDGVHGPELWVSDGTREGTQLVRDLAEGATGSYPFDLTPLGHELRFQSCEGSHCRFYVSDGTEECTRPWEVGPLDFFAGDRNTVVITHSAEGLAQKIVEHLATTEADEAAQDDLEDVAHLAADDPLPSYPVLLDAESSGSDADLDGLPDGLDNCPDLPNALQGDTDGDGIGDACECGDMNGDGVLDTIDARLVERCAREEIPCLGLCDVTGDDVCGATDVKLIGRAVVGSIDKRSLRCAERP